MAIAAGSHHASLSSIMFDGLLKSYVAVSTRMDCIIVWLAPNSPLKKSVLDLFPIGNEFTDVTFC
jgi:hypothetical protein